MTPTTVPIKDVYEDMDVVSDRISTQIRTICLGVLAIVWLFLAGAKDAPPFKLSASPRPLVAIAGLCVTALLLDYLQYFFGYLSSDAVRRKAERAGTGQALYDYSDWRWGLRSLLFWAKQLIGVVAVSWLLALIYIAVG